MSKTTEQELEDALRGILLCDDEGLFGMAIEEARGDDAEEEAPLIDGCRSFADAGILTRDNGLVLRLTDGTEFQITIKRSN